MTLAKSSKDLEQLVTRIHMLIEPAGAKITWNKKIRDPDTDQLRQIDGMIEREGKKTHIECRRHKPPQDVKWIEELIGRRASLGADGVIAVSTSGFTGPAESKAEARGIILRTFSEMTDAEIQAWGKSAKLTTKYIDIEKLKVTVFIDATCMNRISSQPQISVYETNIPPLIGILQEFTNHFGDKFFYDRSSNLTATIHYPGLLVDGVPVRHCETMLRAKLRQDSADVIGVWNYGGVEPTSQDDTTVSKHDFGSTEIIQKDDHASMILDLSSITPPRNCYLHSWEVDFGRIVRAWIEPLGMPPPTNFAFDMMLDVRAVQV
ncbi:restriction endonuclease [Fodinicurvata halophila]|uniref:Restriction endonuclease n=2 Tax=Fodinicurvata halophila TaxID=1419723 RepID=A0ABV8UHQ7_9PROT